MHCVKVPLLSRQGFSGLITSFFTNQKLLGKARRPWPRKAIAKVLCKSHWTCIWPKNSGWWSRYFYSSLSHLGLTLFLITWGHSSERVAIKALWSTQKCPSEGQSFYRVQLNIDANNAGTVLPLPGNRAGVARSVERDAVWWIGFSWCSECKILPA